MWRHRAAPCSRRTCGRTSRCKSRLSGPAPARDHDHTEALWAGPGSGKLYFTRVSCDLHRVDLCVADLATGESKPLIQERMNVYIETKPVRVTSAGELIWWSERDGWGHYYLYDGAGTLKNQITNGEFVAEDVSWVDEEGRALYLTASGHEDGENPYNMHFYRANLDGSGMKLLDAGNGSHAVNMADSGRFFVDTGSRVDRAPKSALYDAQGGMAMPLETVDTAPLTAARLQVSGALHRESRRWRNRSLRRDV